MAEPISKLISSIFYNSKIKDYKEIKKHSQDSPFRGFPGLSHLKLFDIRGKEESHNLSYSNYEEAFFIKYILEYLVFSLGIKRKSKKAVEYPNFSKDYLQTLNKTALESFPKGKIGVITPYSAQEVLLKNILKPLVNANIVDIQTVDGFQGREKGTLLFI